MVLPSQHALAPNSSNVADAAVWIFLRRFSFAPSSFFYVLTNASSGAMSLQSAARNAVTYGVPGHRSPNKADAPPGERLVPTTLQENIREQSRVPAIPVRERMNKHRPVLQSCCDFFNRIGFKLDPWFDVLGKIPHRGRDFYRIDPDGFSIFRYVPAHAGVFAAVDLDQFTLLHPAGTRHQGHRISLLGNFALLTATHYHYGVAFPAISADKGRHVGGVWLSLTRMREKLPYSWSIHGEIDSADAAGGDAG